MINKDFNSIIELLKAFPDEQTCINHLEEMRWNGTVVSPFDSASKVYDCKGNKYKCKNTGKYFNVRTSTLFDNTKVPLQKWFLAIWLVTSHKKGISSLQLGKDIDVTQKTAWFMLQRIRNCFGIDSNDKLDNEVEMDETYIGGRIKNKHAKERKKIINKVSPLIKTTVFGMLERQGRVMAKVIHEVKTANMLPIILDNVSEDATIHTDASKLYQSLYKSHTHFIINHNIGEYVRGDVHTNTIEGFWSLLKRGIVGIYHFTSRKHLQKYVDEFVFRYNNRHFSETEKFNCMLKNIDNRLTYKTLIHA